MKYDCKICHTTRETKGSKRLPKGWKVGPICSDCWRKSHILRAVSFPIASPGDLLWKEFDDLLKPLWRATTAASNWMMTELYIRDCRRNGQEKMPPLSHVYLYPECRARFPDLPPRAVSSLEQAVQRKYRALRYKIVWTCQQSLPNYRYPTPFTLPNQAWTPEWDNGNRPIVHVTIREGCRIVLRLAGGPQFYRQRRQFADLIEGGIICRGDIVFYRRGKKTMVKLVGWLLRKAPTAQENRILSVWTGEKALLETAEGWTLNADQVRRWIAEHCKRLHRLAVDTKAENRPPVFQPRREAMAQKFHDRLHSFCQESASWLCNFALRRKFSGIDLTIFETHLFDPRFPYAQLASAIQQKCDELELLFTSASGDVDKESTQPLEVRKT